MGRRVDSGVQVSLFPFLSILAALIGTLVVIIAAMAIAQLNKVDAIEPEEVDRAEILEVVEKETEELEKERIQLSDRLNRITAARDLLLQLREQRRLKLAASEEKDEVEEDRNELLAEIAQLQKQNGDLNQDLEQLLAQIEELLKELQSRQKEPEKPPVRIQPGGSARGKKASFVEISNKTVILHRKSGEPIRVPAATLETDENFRKLLQFVDAQPYRTLTFLIRGTPESMATYNKAQGIVSAFARTEAKRKNLRAGRLPIPGEGNIDLSVFAEFME